MRKFLTLMMLLLAGQFAQAQDFNDMSPEQRAAFGDAVRQYILENPEIVMEAVGILQDRERVAAVDADRDLVVRYASQLYDDGYSFVGGNPDGQITIVEFIDYRCGYCRRAHAEIRALVSSNPDIRYIVKEFPILGDESVLASRAALAVLVNDGADVYYRMNDLLMTYDGPLNDETVFELASQAGADAMLMSGMMNQPLITEMIANNRSLAQRMQITGTPTFVVGPQMVRGYVAPEIMESILADVRAAIN